MRCPKCGYISYDNVETCLSCHKDISELSKTFQGSTFNVSTPVFLKFLDEEMELQDSGDETEIEFADPDLEILVDGGADADGDEMDFAFGEGQAEDDAATAALSAEFGGESEGGSTADGALDLGMFEDTSEEEVFSFDDEAAGHQEAEPALSAIEEEPEPMTFEEEAEPEAAQGPGLEFPDELADISDLSPPATDAPAATPPTLSFDEPEEEAAPASSVAALSSEPEDDLDFSSLDMDLSLGEETAADPAEFSPAEEKAARRSAKKQDDDLNFELDLGGLSIHDDK